MTKGWMPARATAFSKILVLTIACLAAWSLDSAQAASPKRACGAAPKLVASASGCNGAVLRQYRSQHFLLNTDLSDDQARAQLASLESVVGFATDYWKRPSPGVIECYVADNVEAWPDAALPHPLARISMTHIGGATVTVPGGRSRKSRQRALFFARAGEGIAEHESVHAYCLQAFGSTGPTWYKEGMAELGCYCGQETNGVCVPPSDVEYFRNSPPRTIREIVGQGTSTADISRSLREIVSEELPEQLGRQVPLSSWTAEDNRKVEQAREWYRWNWSLCHFLCCNPNYAARFHRLGQSYVGDQAISFEDAFGDVLGQAEFEYAFFLQQLDVGYRVDLTSWDWATRSAKLPSHKKLRMKVLARGGYQATALSLTAGEEYRYHCKGKWSIDPHQNPTDADGAVRGGGRLIGVIQSESKLSEPIVLGTEGVFAAPTDGHLFVRCEDDWSALSDNTGSIVLTLRRE